MCFEAEAASARRTGYLHMAPSKNGSTQPQESPHLALPMAVRETSGANRGLHGTAISRRPDPALSGQIPRRRRRCLIPQRLVSRQSVSSSITSTIHVPVRFLSGKLQHLSVKPDTTIMAIKTQLELEQKLPEFHKPAEGNTSGAHPRPEETKSRREKKSQGRG